MSAIQLGRIWADTPTSPNIDPGVDKYRLGWVAEIPLYQVLNYINNRYDTNIVSLAERGMFEWGSDVSYNSAAMVWDEGDGCIYLSKVANPNTATRPGLNLTQWDKSSIQISRTQYDLAVANWANHIANTSNPHQLTVDILNTYSKSVIDAKVAVVQTGLSSHTSNTSNPHGVTAVQAGAVPVTGGDYTGLVRHLFASTGIGAATYAAKLFTDSTGTFLALGTNSKLGIDSTNKAVFIDNSAVKSNLLLDSNYISAREAVETSYVPPTPDCHINFRNNLVLSFGSGSPTFTGPASTRGYLDKSGTAQTAALNTPRYTAQGLYVDGNGSTEVLTVPTALNLLNATTFTYCIEFQSTPTTNYIGVTTTALGGVGLSVTGGQYSISYSVGSTLLNVALGAVDHTKPHKVAVASGSTGTSFYLDGVLKFNTASQHNAITGAVINFALATASYLPVYQLGFRTWFSKLTDQQVSNL